MNSNKKVLFIRSNAIDPDSRVEKEVNSLIEGGYDVEILAWDRSINHKIISEEKKLYNSTCKIHKIGVKSDFGGGFKKNLIPLIKFQYHIMKFMICHGKEYGIIHACDFDTAFTSYWMSRKRVKFIYDIFDFYIDSFSVPKILRKIIYNLDMHIINNVDAVVICSEHRLEQIAGNKQDNIYIIHNTPKLIIDLSKEKFKLDKERIKIVYVGILQDGRMIEEMLKFFSEYNEFELHIGGFGKLEKLIQDFAKKNSNIRYYGKMSYEDVLLLEKECDIMTAIYDPKIRNHKYAAPNKFYEALLLGKPLIMVRDTGFSDVVLKNNIGQVIDYNYESFKKGVFELSKNRNDWGKIRLKENELYQREYSWDIMEKRILSLYKGL